MIIYKYKLSYDGITQVTVPHTSSFLDAHIQGDTPYVWFLHNPTSETYERVVDFMIIPTGLEFDPQGLRWIKTFHNERLGLVWHLFSDAPQQF